MLLHPAVFPVSVPAAVLLLPSLLAASPVLNELMVRPAAQEGEWVELLNPDPEPVALGGWILHDATGKPLTLPEAAHLDPGGLLVLAARPESLRAAVPIPEGVAVLRPSGWPVLNDRDPASGQPADVLVLASPDGVVVDSVAYFEAWLPPRNGQSLERVNARVPGTLPATWAWSEDPAGATPGRVNSVILDTPGLDARAVWSGPRRAEPRRRASVFVYRFPGPGTLGVWLLDSEGRVVAMLSEPHPVPAVGRWVWSGTGPVPARSGLYFLCARWRGNAALRRCLPVWVTP